MHGGYSNHSLQGMRDSVDNLTRQLFLYLSEGNYASATAMEELINRVNTNIVRAGGCPVRFDGPPANQNIILLSPIQESRHA